MRTALVVFTRGKGADLVIRRGDPVAETIRLAREVGAEGIALAADVTGYARRRVQRLEQECEKHRLSLRLFPGITVVPPGGVRPSGGGHYKVFSPYYRAWASAKWRDEVGTPHSVTLPPGAAVWKLHEAPTGESADAATGGEIERRRRPSTEAFRRAGDAGWRKDREALQHWQAGMTGVPVVDAGMRQLRAEGWMRNRARLITASFLTKHPGLDWRDGVRWFFRWLTDGDVPNNSGNWQWVAGTGNDTRPHRRFNPGRRATRFDPDGRYVPELKSVDGPAVHQPWRLPDAVRLGLDYPGPLESQRDDAVWMRP